MFYDIIVVGAGPAGSSAASEASKGGAKVLVVEKKKIIGEPVQCAEFIPKLLFKEIILTTQSIAQEVTKMKVYFPDGECFEAHSPGYILNRNIFDKELAIAAEKNGVDIFINTVCLKKRDNKVIIKKGGKEAAIATRIIIGADGPRSTVGGWIKEVNKDFAIAAQYEIPLAGQMNSTEVYFDKEFEKGYAWLFPKGNLANVGVGIKYMHGNKVSTHKILDKFVKKLVNDGKVKPFPVSFASGLIPLNGPRHTVRDNIVLVGDAAGQTHPITGAGIPQAIMCGKIAGKAAARAIKEKNLKYLQKYEEEWQKIFGEELTRAMNRRRLLDSSWERFEEVLKRCWVTFKEYYE